jgi:hypothetical protein
MPELQSKEIDLSNLKANSNISHKIAEEVTTFINSGNYKLEGFLWVDRTTTLIIFYRNNDN